jgi:hypothetical protein
MNNVRLCGALLFFSAVAAAQTLEDGSFAVAEERFAETQARDNLIGLLKDRNIAFRERPLMADYGAFGVSIRAEIPGADGGGLFVLAVPLAAPRTDGGITWGQELAFAFMERLLRKAAPFDTLVCFLADNRPAVPGGGAYPYAGLQALLDDIYGRDDAVIAYCDFSEAPSVLTLTRGRGRASVPLILAELFIKACDSTETPYFFAAGAYQTESVIAEPGGGIPVLYLDGSAAARFARANLAARPAVAADKAAETLYGFADAAMTGRAGAEADRNYAYLRFRGGIFVSEYTLVLLALFVPVFCFLLYRAFKSRHRRILTPMLAAALLVTAAPLAVLYSNGARAAPTLPTSVRSYLPDAARKKKNIERLPFSSRKDALEQYFTANVKAVPFLERRIVRIRIEARRTPLHYGLSFTEQKAEGVMETPVSFLYDAPMPYTEKDGLVSFVLGDYPPALLNLEITLPLYMDGYFTLDALFEDGTALTETFFLSLSG